MNVEQLQDIMMRGRGPATVRARAELAKRPRRKGKLVEQRSPAKPEPNWTDKQLRAAIHDLPTRPDRQQLQGSPRACRGPAKALARAELGKRPAPEQGVPPGALEPGTRTTFDDRSTSVHAIRLRSKRTASATTAATSGHETGQDPTADARGKLSETRR